MFVIQQLISTILGHLNPLGYLLLYNQLFIYLTCLLYHVMYVQFSCKKLFCAMYINQHPLLLDYNDYVNYVNTHMQTLITRGCHCFQILLVSTVLHSFLCLLCAIFMPSLQGAVLESLGGGMCVWFKIHSTLS